MAKLQDMINDALKGIDVDRLPNLNQEVLEAIVMDVFRIDLCILPAANLKKLLARVDLESDSQHIDDFIAKHSLNYKKERLLEIRKYIFENCEELSFESSYMATFRRATSLVVVYDYHEFGNEGVNITERRKDIINILIPGFLVGYFAGVIAAYVPTFSAIASNIFYNTNTQGLIWGSIAACGLYVGNRLVKSISKGSRTESKRERKDNLGREIIINDEASLEALQKSLGRDYDEFKPPKESYFSELEYNEGRYSGRKALYRLKAEQHYVKFRRKSKPAFNLFNWLQNNPNSPLFGVVLATTIPSNIIGSVILTIKIGNERKILHTIKSFQYDPTEQVPANQIKEYKSAIYLLD